MLNTLPKARAIEFRSSSVHSRSGLEIFFMELAVIFIAFFMGTLALFAFVLTILGVVMGSRLLNTLKIVEGLLEDLRRETVPALSHSREILADVNAMSSSIREQLGKTEAVVEDTLQNIHEATSRIRQTIDGLTYILSALGRVSRIFSKSRGD